MFPLGGQGPNASTSRDWRTGSARWPSSRRHSCSTTRWRGDPSRGASRPVTPPVRPLQVDSTRRPLWGQRDQPPASGVRRGRIDVRYSIRNVLPGSNRRRFGSPPGYQRPPHAIHHADAPITSWPATPARQADTSPIDLRCASAMARSCCWTLRGAGSGAAATHRRSRSRRAIAPHAHSFYNVRLDLDDGHALHRVIGKATFSTDHGFESQRWTAAEIPVGRCSISRCLALSTSSTATYATSTDASTRLSTPTARRTPHIAARRSRQGRFTSRA